MADIVQDYLRSREDYLSPFAIHDLYPNEYIGAGSQGWDWSVLRDQLLKGETGFANILTGDVIAGITVDSGDVQVMSCNMANVITDGLLPTAGDVWNSGGIVTWAVENIPAAGRAGEPNTYDHHKWRPFEIVADPPKPIWDTVNIGDYDRSDLRGWTTGEGWVWNVGPIGSEISSASNQLTLTLLACSTILKHVPYRRVPYALRPLAHVEPEGRLTLDDFGRSGANVSDLLGLASATARFLWRYDGALENLDSVDERELVIASCAQLVFECEDERAWDGSFCVEFDDDFDQNILREYAEDSDYAARCFNRMQGALEFVEREAHMRFRDSDVPYALDFPNLGWCHRCGLQDVKLAKPTRPSPMEHCPQAISLLWGIEREQEQER